MALRWSACSSSQMVRQHGAQGALTALGWSSEAALELAAFASHALPERAKELATLVPASVLVPKPRYLGSESAVAPEVRMVRPSIWLIERLTMSRSGRPLCVRAFSRIRS